MPEERISLLFLDSSRIIRFGEGRGGVWGGIVSPAEQRSPQVHQFKPIKPIIILIYLLDIIENCFCFFLWNKFEDWRINLGHIFHDKGEPAERAVKNQQARE